MNHPERNSTVVAKILLFLTLAFLATIYLIQGRLSPSVAQSTEREFEDRVPKHLPIKVKLKKEKEKAVKDLNNEKWVRDLELEVTNTGNKPIYYLSLLIVLPGITAPTGHEMGFSLHYGRGELASIETKAEADDVPLKPGETYVFSLSELRVMNWERFRKRENKPDAKKLILLFQILNFGDGTGFVGTNGLALPRAPDAKSGLDHCNPGLRDSSGLKSQHASRRRWPQILPTDDLPASFLLANFLVSEALVPTSLNLKPQSQLCCLGNDNDCFRSKTIRNNCLCDPDGKPAITGTSCSDPFGARWSPI